LAVDVLFGLAKLLFNTDPAATTLHHCKTEMPTETIPISALLMPCHISGWLQQLHSRMQQQPPGQLSMARAAALTCAMLTVLQLPEVQAALGPATMKIIEKDVMASEVVKAGRKQVGVTWT
jgi:hypothetical protein